jgi:hypothetical protein
LRSGPQFLSNGEAQVAQRAFMRVEAQDLCRGGGALKRQACAQRPGGGRVATQDSVEEGEAGPAKNSGSPSALPLARAQVGTGEVGNGCAGKRLAWIRLGSRDRPDGRSNGLRDIGGPVGEQGGIGANHRGMMSLARRFVDCSSEESAPLVGHGGCPISLHYRT